MKFKQIYFPAFFILVFVLVSCGQQTDGQADGTENTMTREQQGRAYEEEQSNARPDMHARHNSLANNFAHEDVIILEDPYQLSGPAEAEMEQVISMYLQLKDALVKDDEKATDRAVNLLTEAVAAVEPAQLNGNGLEAWQNHQALYETKLKEMRHIEGLENKRSYFSHISEIMYCTIKSFGLKTGDLFAAFCPMAFDGKGAYWISGDEEIQNPYFGQAMLTCGEIRETL